MDGKLILDKKYLLVYICHQSERCCVKRTLNMTSKVSVLNDATQGLNAQMNKSAFNRGKVGVVNIVAALERFGLTRDDMQNNF